MQPRSFPKEAPRRGSSNRRFVDAVWRVILRDGLRCRACGDTDESRLNVDHVVPKALGGPNTIANLQILCLRCHRDKDRYVSRDAQALRDVPLPEVTWNHLE